MRETFELPPSAIRLIGCSSKSGLPGYAGTPAVSGTLTSRKRGTAHIAIAFDARTSAYRPGPAVACSSDASCTDAVLLVVIDRRSFVSRCSDEHTFLSCALAVLAAAGAAAGRNPTRVSGRSAPSERTSLEGEAIVALADAAMRRRARALRSRPRTGSNDFLKAQQGTFVPFVVTIDAPALTRPSAAALRAAGRARRRAARAPSVADVGRGRLRPSNRAFPVEEIYPIDVRRPPVQRVSRAVSRRQPGEYDLVVVVRERVDPEQPALPRRAGVLTRRLDSARFPDRRADDQFRHPGRPAHGPRDRTPVRAVGGTPLPHRAQRHTASRR